MAARIAPERKRRSVVKSTKRENGAKIAPIAEQFSEQQSQNLYFCTRLDRPGPAFCCTNGIEYAKKPVDRRVARKGQNH
jgi:hypothetical protein